MSNNFFLAWRLLQRDWNAGELKILLLALIIAVASMTSIGMFIQRIDRAMTDQTGQFLGADLVLRSSVIIDNNILDYAKHAGLKTTSSISFSSVIVANDEFQLTHVKAVDNNYPLLSNIKISSTLYGQEKAINYGPASGEVWLAPRLFSLVNISIGDSIELGEANFTVSGVLKHDPGQAGSFMSIAPRLLMNIKDVDKTAIIQDGSRVNYLAGFAGKIEDRKKLQDWLKPQLNPSQSLIGGTEGSQAISSAMSKAEQYLALSAMLSVMLSGIAIAMTANHYAKRHFDQSALMRCMGATQKTIMQIFTFQLIILGTAGSLAGCVAGYLTQEGLVVLLKNFLTPDLPSPGFYPFLVGFISGFITLAGFSLPALLRLKSVPPLRVLRRDINPMPVSSLLIYCFALSSIIILMWWQSGQLKLTLLVVIGVIVSVLVLLVLTFILIHISKLFTPLLTGPWKIGLKQIIRHKKENQLQMLAFGLSLMVLMTIYLLRTDLITRWENQLPEDAPNHFVINIQQYEVAGVKTFFDQYKVPTEGLYPMVRGRISEINDRPVSEVFPDKSKLDASLKRELNLSWSINLQKNNRIIDGDWWTDDDIGKTYISIEKSLAKRLMVSIGDKLSFSIADQNITATVKSTRSVQWDSFQPNFFILFPDRVINDFPVSYISSFYIPAHKKNILNALVAAYPTLTVLEIDEIMNQVKSIMQQVTTAVEYVMLFVLLAGSMVLIASMQSGMSERIHSNSIMRILGANSRFISRSQISEYTLLGLFSGVLAVSGAEAITFILYRLAFNLEFEFHLWLWLTGPVISIVLILLISQLYTHKTTQQAPLKSLNCN